MNESTRNWSQTRTWAAAGKKEVLKMMRTRIHACVDSLPLTVGSRTHSAHPTGKPKEAQHPKHPAPAWEPQMWQTPNAERVCAARAAAPAAPAAATAAAAAEAPLP